MDIYNLSYPSLEKKVLEWGFKKYRAAQIWNWLYKIKVSTFSDMKNLPKDLISKLSSNFNINSLTCVIKNTSDDGTVKLLFSLHDGHLIETVLIKHHYGNSICITTQVGCNIGCSFCASGQLAKKRDLTSGEMISQVLETERLLEKKINRIIVMGIGEPFDNYKNLLTFLNIVNDPKGISIGARHITVSTSGLVNKIKDFAMIDGQFNLAISLHAPDDETRSKLMKINDRFPVGEVIDAIKYYQEHNRRRVTIEYILINEVNDSSYHALKLVEILKGLNVYVNLIPYNPVIGNDYERSTPERINAFNEILIHHKLNTTLRKEQGADINAACGQLRSIQMNNNKEKSRRLS